MWKEIFSFCFCCRSRGNKSIRYNKSRKMWKGVVLRGKLPFRCALSHYTHLLAGWKASKWGDKDRTVSKCCTFYFVFLRIAGVLIHSQEYDQSNISEKLHIRKYEILLSTFKCYDILTGNKPVFAIFNLNEGRSVALLTKV